MSNKPVKPKSDWDRRMEATRAAAREPAKTFRPPNKMMKPEDVRKK